jgi:hypothetical protein
MEHSRLRRCYRGMKAVLILATMLFAGSSATADQLDRLRNASANELCWDTVRGFAREKYPTVKIGEPIMTQANYSAPAASPSPIKESRKAFPGIRTC